MEDEKSSVDYGRITVWMYLTTPQYTPKHGSDGNFHVYYVPQLFKH